MNEQTTPEVDNDRQVYFIIETALPLLERRFAALARTATRLGARFSYEINRNRFKEETVDINPKTKRGTIVRFYEVVVEGTRPRFSGWNLRGTIQHTSEGNVLRLVPGTGQVPEDYRTNSPCCDHCRVKRQRRDTYIVQHEDGTFKQVGSNCLKDFLGHQDPQFFARVAAIWMTVAEMVSGGGCGLGGGMGEVFRYNLLQYLTVVATVIRVSGTFISRRIARERTEAGNSTQATADLAEELHRFDEGFYAGNDAAAKAMHRLRQRFATVDADVAQATAARDYVVSKFSVPMDFDNDPASIKAALLDLGTARENLTEFEHNLFVVAKCEGVEPRTTGIAAYLVQYYRQEMDLIVKRAARPVSQHIGEPKKRLRNLQVTVEKIIPVETVFGWMDIVRMVDAAGNVLVLKSGSDHGLVEEHTFTVDATVKKHDDYKGTKQTVINRVAIKTGVVQPLEAQAA